MENSSSSSRNDRKTTERNRRNQMKSLYSQLNSLLPPPQTSQELVSLPDQIDAATKHIKKLQITIEKMREKKDSLIRTNNYNTGSTYDSVSNFPDAPQVEVHENGSALGIVLVTGRDHLSMFMNSVRILHEEGVEIINASFCVRDKKVFHSIHSKVGNGAPRFLAARVSERLNNAIVHGHGSTTSGA